MDILFWFSVFLVGLWLLMRAAGTLVHAAVQTMHHYHISSSAFGIIVLASLTALPETFVAVTAALAGTESLSYGSLLGSNTVNLPIVIGLALFINGGIKIHNIIWTRRHGLFLSFAVIIASITLFDQQLTRLDGFLLLMVFALYLYSIFISEWEHAKVKKEMKTESWLWRRLHHHIEIVKKKKRHTPYLRLRHSSIVLLILGTGGLLIASNILVYSANFLSHAFGISELYVGLIGLGLGTALPEVAASLTAVKNGQASLGLSNIIGDNIATILLALGITGLIHPIDIEPVSLFVDIPLLIGVTVSFTLLLFVRPHITRTISFLSLLIFAGIIFAYTYFHCFSSLFCT